MQGLIVCQSSGLELHPQAWVLKGISVDRPMLLCWKSSSEGQHVLIFILLTTREDEEQQKAASRVSTQFFICSEDKGEAFPISPPTTGGVGAALEPRRFVTMA